MYCKSQQIVFIWVICAVCKQVVETIELVEFKIQSCAAYYSLQYNSVEFDSAYLY